MLQSLPPCSTAARPPFGSNRSSLTNNRNTYILGPHCYSNNYDSYCFLCAIIIPSTIIILSVVSNPFGCGDFIIFQCLDFTLIGSRPPTPPLYLPLSLARFHTVYIIHPLSSLANHLSLYFFLLLLSSIR